MFYKFLFLRLLFILSFVFFAFTNRVIRGNEQNAVKSDNQTTAQCNIALDLKDCPIQIRDYLYQAQNLTTELAFINENNSLTNFNNLQYVEVKYASIISAINAAVNSEDCVIAGMRFFNTLDRNTSSIKLYCSPVYASNPTKNGSYYYFNFNSKEGSLSEIISANKTPLYALENGELKDISEDEGSLAEAAQRWEDYKKHIRIDKTFFPGMRSFKDGEDFNSFFFPLAEFEGSQQSANNQDKVYIVSSVKKMSSKYYNVINFGNVPPNPGNYPIQNRPNSDVNSDYFIGMASNLAHLCPTNCGKLRATKIDGKEIYKLDGNR